jgi:hypothetical protein
MDLKMGQRTHIIQTSLFLLFRGDLTLPWYLMRCRLVESLALLLPFSCSYIFFLLDLIISSRREGCPLYNSWCAPTHGVTNTALIPVQICPETACLGFLLLLLYASHAKFFCWESMLVFIQTALVTRFTPEFPLSVWNFMTSSQLLESQTRFLVNMSNTRSQQQLR